MVGPLNGFDFMSLVLEVFVQEETGFVQFVQCIVCESQD